MVSKITVGILTFHCAHNYGAMLQAYALQNFLKHKIDTDVRIIDFKPKSYVEKNKILKKAPNTLRQLFLWGLTLLKYRKLRKRFCSFEEFYDEMFNKTKCYRLYEELKQDPPMFDIVISGSDQVFHPNRPHSDVYYLNFFANSKVKNVAYAPSFGVASIPEEKKEKIQALLQRFDYLSCRELEGCAIIKELSGKEVDCVLDPVFLLPMEEWLSTLKIPFNKPFSSYILVYALVGYKKQMAVAEKIKNYLKIPIVLIRTAVAVTNADKTIYNAGPKEFIHLFANADYIVTDSFHGTSFSIIFNKPFLSVITRPDVSSRITTLLNRTHLNKRAILDVKKVSDKDITCDFHQPNRLLEQERMHSINFLKTAIVINRNKNAA